MRGNLSKQVHGMGLGGPEIGQTFYLVDADYRTQAQGWWRPDGTGPLDLFEQRNPGYVFRTDKYSNDRNAIQAAIDAAIDFRGDAVFLTPGSYSLASALSINVPDLRILGPKVSTPRGARVTITDAIGSGCTATADADRLEVAYLRFIPLTATTLWSCAAAMDNGHFHDFFYDADGIGASTSTIFFTHAGTTMNHWTFENFDFLTDAAQGPLISVTGVQRGTRIYDYRHMHEAGTLASALLNITGTGTGPVSIETGRGNTAVAGVVTTLVTIVEGGSDLQWLSLRDIRNSIGYCAATALVTIGTAEAAETGLAACYLDVVGGAAGGAGTTYTQ